MLSQASFITLWVPSITGLHVCKKQLIWISIQAGPSDLFASARLSLELKLLAQKAGLCASALAREERGVHQDTCHCASLRAVAFHVGGRDRPRSQRAVAPGERGATFLLLPCVTAVGSVCVLHDDCGAGRERVETKWKGFPGDKPRGTFQGLRF